MWPTNRLGRQDCQKPRSFRCQQKQKPEKWHNMDELFLDEPSNLNSPFWRSLRRMTEIARSVSLWRCQHSVLACAPDSLMQGLGFWQLQAKKIPFSKTGGQHRAECESIALSICTGQTFAINCGTNSPAFFLKHLAEKWSWQWKDLLWLSDLLRSLPSGQQGQGIQCFSCHSMCLQCNVSAAIQCVLLPFPGQWSMLPHVPSTNKIYYMSSFSQMQWCSRTRSLNNESEVTFEYCWLSIKLKPIKIFQQFRT